MLKFQCLIALWFKSHMLFMHKEAIKPYYDLMIFTPTFITWKHIVRIDENFLCITIMNAQHSWVIKIRLIESVNCMCQIAPPPSTQWWVIYDEYYLWIRHELPTIVHLYKDLDRRSLLCHFDEPVFPSLGGDKNKNVQVQRLGIVMVCPYCVSSSSIKWRDHIYMLQTCLQGLMSG